MHIDYVSEVSMTQSVFKRALKGELADFSEHQTYTLRILAVSSSATAIVFALVSFYFFFAIAPKRLVFRHQLIIFLIFFDLVKSIILLLYPARVIVLPLAYYNKNFCEVVGFFTALSIEGADLAILSFAIHTFLLIFRPSMNVKVKYDNVEGGLYKYRYAVYIFSFITPCVIASLAFIRNSNYQPETTWCYLPASPSWFRLALSWIPRYCILVIIIIIYGTIYYHVMKEFQLVGGVLSTLHKKNQQEYKFSNLSFKGKLLYIGRSCFDYFVPKFVLPEARSQQSTPTSEEPSKIESHDHANILADTSSQPQQSHNLANLEVNAHFREQNLETFKIRQSKINKQMKSIFIYPIAYIIIWIFPFILQVTQMGYEQRHGPIYWIHCGAAFMQPFFGVVDSLVFMYREKPWEFTCMRVEQNKMTARIDKMSGSFSSNFMLRDDSVAIESYEYSWWRQQLNWLGLPLFQLPTSENMNQFQLQYIDKKLGKDAARLRESSGNISNFTSSFPHSHHVMKSGNNGRTIPRINPNDFSAIFGTADTVNTHLERSDPSLDTFRLDFQQRRLPLDDGNVKFRQTSNIDPVDPGMLDGRTVNDSYNSADTSDIVRTDIAYFKNTTEDQNKPVSPSTFVNSGIQTPTRVSPRNNRVFSVPNAPVRNPSNLYVDEERRENNNEEGSDDDDGLDFLDFLRRGPV